MAAFAAPTHAEGEGKLSANTNEHLFQCGAAFSMMEQVYKMASEHDKSAQYKAKFDTVADRAEKVFEAQGKSKQDAADYMQKNADVLAVVVEKDAKLVMSFVSICDERYPSEE